MAMAPSDRRTIVLPETVAVAALGCADLLYTAYLLAAGTANEGNPMMRAVLTATGPIGLITAKTVLLVGPLAVAEWARTYHEATVRVLLRLVVVAYPALWLWGMARINRWL